MNGGKSKWNGKKLYLEWAKGQPRSMHAAGNGPRALGVAGAGDGVIIDSPTGRSPAGSSTATRTAAVEAGRDPDALAPIVVAPAVVDADLPRWREETRWFPAMVSNHVKDLIARYGTEGEIPTALTEYALAVKEYDYNEHSLVGASHGQYISDEICDRFCLLGDADQHIARLRELEGLGVKQVNLYLMTSEFEATMERYGREIIPQFEPATVPS